MRWSSIRGFFKFLYNRVIPLGLMIFTLWGMYHICQRLEPLAYDWLTRWTVQPAIKSPVVLVLIDDESIKRLEPRFGPILWKRTAYIDIFKRIQGYAPAVMVFDTNIVNMNRKEDPKIFETLQQFPHLISGMALDSESIRHKTYPLFYQLQLGVVNTESDTMDGVIRKIQPIFQSQQGIYPALSLASVLEYQKSLYPQKKWITDMGPGYLASYPEDEGKAKGLSIQLNGDNKFLIHWYKLIRGTTAQLGQSHHSIPLWMLYEPHKIPSGFLKNKIVLLGASSIIYRDYQKTPIHEHHLGVDIHATAIDNFLFSENLSPAPPGMNALWLLVFSLSICILRIRLKSFNQTILYTAGLMAFYAYMVYMQFTYQNLALDIVTPETFMLVGLLVGSIYRNTQDDYQVRTMEQTLSQLVSQSVFREIERLGYVLKPGGNRLEITSVFVDIRNFSSFAEHMPPQDLTLMLNEFYTDVEKITFQHRGTIDKFMGDGILIIFGAPIPSENHAEQAFIAVLDILKATEALCEKWRAEKQIDAEMGISLNSGQAFVGFIGPVYKLEYTAIGDTVNITVRLQEQNKRFQVPLVISEYTVERLTNQEPLRELGQVVVKGRETPIRIFTIQKLLSTEATEDSSGMGG